MTKRTRRIFLVVFGAMFAVIAAMTTILCVTLTRKNKTDAYAAGETPTTPATYYWGLVADANDETRYNLIISSDVNDTAKADADKKGEFSSAIDNGFLNGERAPWHMCESDSVNIVSVEIKGNEIKGKVAPNSTAYWFNGCEYLERTDFTGLDTSSVTDMRYMFSDCSSLTSLDLSSFNTSNVKYMSGMFSMSDIRWRHETQLTSINLSSFDTTDVLDMSNMFSDCYNLIGTFGKGGTAVNIGDYFDTSAVTNMNSMFKGCGETNYDSGAIISGMTSLDLSGFDTTNVQDMENMFNGCGALVGSFGKDGTAIKIGENFKTGNVINMSGMFSDCRHLTSLDLTTFNTANVYDMSNMFSRCDGLRNDSDNSDEISFGKNGTSIKIGINFRTDMVRPVRVNDYNTDYDCMAGMFSGTNLTSIDLSSFNSGVSTTENVTDMSFMFSSCSSLTSINLSGFNTSAVTNMGGMFACGKWDPDSQSYVSSLTSLDLSSFDTSKVTGPSSGLPTGMSEMFKGCTKLKSIDLTSFDTSNVGDMSEMFSWCFGLTGTFGKDGTAIKIGDNFITSQVDDFGGMFHETGLTEIDMSDLDITASTNGIADLFSSGSGKSVGKTEKIILPSAEKMGNTIIRIPVRFLCEESGKEPPYDGYYYIVDRNDAGTVWLRDDPHVVETPATCTEQAICKVCHKPYGDPLGHSITADDDCTKTVLCERCGEPVREAQAAHAFEEWRDKGDGNHYRSCSNSCYHYYDCEVKQIEPHDYDEKGVCTVCGGAREIYWAIEEVQKGGNTEYTFYISWDKSVTNGATYSGSFSSNQEPDESSPWVGCLAEEYELGYDYTYIILSKITTAKVLHSETYGDVKPTSTSSWFEYFKGLTSVDLSGLDTSAVIDMDSMFYECSSLKTLDLSGFDTSAVIDISYMFYECSSLASLDLSSFDLSKIGTDEYSDGDTEEMFEDCKNLKTIVAPANMGTNYIDMPRYKYAPTAKCCWTTDEDGVPTPIATPNKITSGCAGKTLTRHKEHTYIDNNVCTICQGAELYWGIDSNKLIISTEKSDTAICANKGTFASCELFDDGATPWSNYESRITSVEVLEGATYGKVKPTTTAYWFYQLNRVTSFDLSGLDTSAATDMSSMFQSCSLLQTLDLSGLDTSAVKNMSQMFCGCYDLTELDLSSFDTSAVTNMSNMFSSCSSLKTLDLSGFDTSAVTDMSNMFSSCSSLKTLDVSRFNTGKVEDMSNMFYNCSSLKTLDVSRFNTGKVENMSYMFQSCSLLKTLNVSGFDTSVVTDMNGMFQGCSSLQTLDVSSFNTSNVRNINNMFQGCSSLKTLNVSSFNTSNVRNINSMFQGCSSLQTLDLSNFNTSNVNYSMDHMFDGCSSLQTLDLSNFNTSNVYNMEDMFSGCSSLQTLDLSSFNTSNVYDMNYMFYECSSLKTIDLSSFDMSTVTNMYRIDNCYNLNTIKAPKNMGGHTLDLPQAVCRWTIDEGGDRKPIDTQNTLISAQEGKTLKDGHVYNNDTERKCTLCSDDQAQQIKQQIYYVIQNNKLTISLDVTRDSSGGGSFDHKAGSFDFDATFDNTVYENSTPWERDSGTITSVEVLESADHGKVKPISTAYWFEGLFNVTSIDLSGLDTSAVTSMNSMFENCASLKTLDVSGLKTSAVTNMNSMFYGCQRLTELNLSSFDIAAGTTVTNMIGYCTKLIKIYASTDMGGQPITLPKTGCYWALEGSGYEAKITEISSAVAGETITNVGHVYGADDATRTCTVCGVVQKIYWGVKQTQNSNIYNFTLSISLDESVTEGATNSGSFAFTAEFDNSAQDENLHTPWDIGDIGSVAVLNAHGKVKPTSTAYWFEGLSKVASIDLSGLDTSAVTNMRDMFKNCSNLRSIDLSGFDTSAVTNMSEMFYGCGCRNEKFTSLDLSSFDTSNVKNMSEMFYNSAVTEVDLSSFDTSAVTNMKAMFSGCERLTELDLSSFNTSNVKNMSEMFYGCKNEKFTSLDLGNFDTSNVTNMYSMFANCEKLTTLDMSGFDLSAIVDDEVNSRDGTAKMLEGCTGLNKVFTPETVGAQDITLPDTFLSNDSLSDTQVISYDNSHNELIRHAACVESEWIEDKEATCTEAGSQHKECTVCGATLATEPIEARRHYWSDWEVIKPATETESGKQSRICEYCEKTETQPIPMLEHTHDNPMAHEEALEATCTKVGNVEFYYCSGCGLYFDFDEYNDEYYKIAASSIEIPATGHRYGAWVTTQEAAEGVNGEETRTCQNGCGKIETRTIPALSHTHALTRVAKVPATCTEVGKDEHYKCSGCGTLFDKNKAEVNENALTLAAEGHKWGDWVVTTPATATEYGVKTRTCTICSEEETGVVQHVHDELVNLIPEVAATCTTTGTAAHYECYCGALFDKDKHEVGEATLTLAAKGHTYSDWIEDEAATCTQEGLHHKECTECGEEKLTESRIPPMGHSASWVVGKAATCTEAGSKLYKCANCGETLATESVEAFKHAWGEWTVITEATEKSDGVMVRECSTCHTGESQPIPKLNHSHVYGTLEEEVEATCTKAGNVEYCRCTGCGLYFDRYGNVLNENELIKPALGHNWSAWAVTKEASEGVSGERARTCSACKETERRPIAALGHTHAYAHSDGVEATCTAEGLSAHYHCAGCGLYFDEEYKEVTYNELIITKAAHTVSDWKVDKAATCTEPGFRHTECTECGITLSNSTIEATEHNASWVVSEAATCTEVGSRQNKCSKCGEILETESIAAIGHDWGEWTVITEATETESGEQSRTCSNCGETETGLIGKLNHTHDDPMTHEVAKEATCTVGGNVEYYFCAGCGLYFDAANKEMTASELITPAKGHNWGAWETTKAATETENGEEARTCKTCGKTERTTISALGHTHVYTYVDKVAATCTTTGTAAHNKCASCGALFDTNKHEVIESELVIAANGHVWGAWAVTTPAGEATSGEETRYCNVCNRKDTRTVPPTGHTAHTYVKQDGVAPTCTTAGTAEHYTCTCGAFFIFDEEYKQVAESELELAAKGHTAGDWEVDEAATCTEEGSHHKKCTKCGETLATSTLAPTGHSASWVTIKEANCTEAGSRSYKCATCGATLATESIDATGHNWGGWTVITAATETANGVMARECSACHTGDTQTISKLNHTHVYGKLVNEVEATCTKAGKAAHYHCEGCGLFFDRYGKVVNESELVKPAKGHNFGDWVITKPATEAEGGEKTTSCSGCGITESRPIPALGHTHNYTHADEVAATCTAEGLRAHNKCAGCGLYFDEEHKEVSYNELIIAKTAHTVSEWKVDKAATCTESGLQHTECTECGITLGNSTIAATGHTESEWIVSKAATCEEAGSRYKKCTKCGETLRSEPVAAIGHDWGEWTVITEATETANGEKSRTCKGCGDTETSAIAMLGHTHNYVKQDGVAATCTTAGMREHYKCTGCGLYFDKDHIEKTESELVIPATGHSLGSWVITKAASEGITGERKRTCTGCDYSETEVIPALAHTHVYTYVAEVPATCTATGTKAHYKCAGCGTLFDTDKKEVAEKDLVLALTGHTWGDWVITKAATETAHGVKTRACTNCGETETGVVPVAGHTHTLSELIAEVAANCTKTGTAAHYECSCGALFDKAEHEVGEVALVLPVKGHTYGDWSVTTAATETASGVKTRTCACGKTETKSIPALGHTHNYGELVAEVAATCEEEGKKAHYHCEGCGLYFDADKKVIAESELAISAKGHKWGEWTVHKTATVDEFGEERRVCEHDQTHYESRKTAKLPESNPPEKEKKGLSTGAILAIVFSIIVFLLIVLYCIGLVLYIKDYINWKICKVLYFYVKKW